MQISFNFDPHPWENNSESQTNLETNKDKFSKKCRIVFNLLMDGEKLTVLGCANLGISSLPRRILDLKQNEVKISDYWENGVKVYFLTASDRLFNKRFK